MPGLEFHTLIHRDLQPRQMALNSNSSLLFFNSIWLGGFPQYEQPYNKNTSLENRYKQNLDCLRKKGSVCLWPPGGLNLGWFGSVSHSERVGKWSSLALGIEMVLDESACYKNFLDRIQENLHMIWIWLTHKCYCFTLLANTVSLITRSAKCYYFMGPMTVESMPQ